MAESKEIEVLIACMNQSEDFVNRLYLDSNALIINQTDSDSNRLIKRNNFNIDFRSTTERGLSKSRNMALTYSKGDICVICDDDVVLSENYAEVLSNAYAENQDADIIVFQLVESKNKRYYKKYPLNRKYLNKYSVLRVSSCEITFKRSSILSNNIRFNEDFGAGSQNNCPGEENLFLKQALDSGLRILYVPSVLGELQDSESTWFKGYNYHYYYFKGVFCRMYFGRFLGFIYLSYFILKTILKPKDGSLFTLIKGSLKGLFNLSY